MQAARDRCTGAEQWPLHRVDDIVNACFWEQWDRVLSALDAGFPVNAKGGTCGTCPASLLHWAAWGAHVPVLRRLLAAGAVVDTRDDHQQTPAHYAACRASVGPLAALVEAGADVNAGDYFLESPLFRAVVSSLPCTRYLLTLPQVELSTVNRSGLTAEKLARVSCRFEAAEAVRAEVRERLVWGCSVVS